MFESSGEQGLCLVGGRNFFSAQLQNVSLGSFFVIIEDNGDLTQTTRTTKVSPNKRVYEQNNRARAS